MSRPEPVDHPLSIWIVNPLDDIPGENVSPTRSWSLARVLATRGHDVTLWSATWSHRRHAVRSAPLGVFEDEGFAVRLVAVRPYERDLSRSRLASHRDFGRTFERLANESVAAEHLERPDIILASMPPIAGAEAAARVAKRLDAQFVVDILALWPESLERLLPGPFFLRGLVRPFLLGGMQRRRDEAIAAADAISAASQEMIDALPAAAHADVPKHLCPLGSYPQQFPPPPRVLDHVPPAEGIVLMHGRTDDTKRPLACVHAGSPDSDADLDTLIAAVRQLASVGTPVTVHVIGGGRHESALRAAAASLTGPARIIVHRPLEREASVELLERCDVGLVLDRPGSVKSIPGDACDYAAAGLAVVSGLPGPLDALIAEAEAGLPFTAGDSASLARAIATFAEDRRRLLACRQAARRLAERVFDREKLLAAFADWLQGLRVG